MNPIPQTETIIAFYFDNDITSIIYDYLLFNLHTQKEYAIYGIHEALEYPRYVINHMLDMFDDDILFDTILKCSAHTETYVYAILSNRLSLAKRIAESFNTIYKSDINFETFFTEEDFEYYPSNFKFDEFKHYETSVESINYIIDMFSSDKDMLNSLITVLLYENVIRYDNIMRTKHNFVIDKSFAVCKFLYEKYDYVYFHFINKYDIPKLLLEIYGFKKARKPHEFSSEIFEFETEKINYRNIYKNIDLLKLLDEIKYIKYNKTKYLLECTDIISGYDPDTVYEMSYNVYRNLSKKFIDIKFDLKKMYAYSFYDNDITGMDFALQLIDKSTFDPLDPITKMWHITDNEWGWKKFILDSHSVIHHDLLCEQFVLRALDNNIPHILAAMITVKCNCKVKLRNPIKYDYIDPFLLAHKNCYIKPLIPFRYDYYNIIEWSIKNNRNIFIEKKNFYDEKLMIALSYKTDIRMFMRKFSSKISIEVLRTVCRYHNLDIHDVI